MYYMVISEKIEQGRGAGLLGWGKSELKIHRSGKILQRRQLSKDMKKIKFYQTVINSEAPKVQGRVTYF